MQLIIDTAKDSKEELKKAAKFLMDIAGESLPENDGSNNVVPDSSPEMFSMFGDDSQSSYSDSGNNQEEPKPPGKDPKIEIIEW